MKTTGKILKWIGIIFSLVIIGFFLFVQFSWDKKFHALYPDIKSNSDSASIERGMHLAFGPAHCATCHIPMDKILAVEEGLKMPLIGGWELPIPPGTFRAPNITPDIETGIGNMSDGAIARVLRYSVNRNDGIVFAFMPFQELSDDDLTAIISFLRSQESVKNMVEPSKLSFLGKALMALGFIKPVGPINTPPKSVVIDTTATYGSYLAKSVGNCIGCHSEINMMTGALLEPHYAGGTPFPADVFSMGYSFISPNLTPHKETGVIANWDEKTFITRFHAGRVIKGSPMPWGAFSKMYDSELKALYRFFQSLDPVENKIAKTVFNPDEKLPK